MDNEKDAVKSFLGEIGETKENPFETIDPFADKQEEEVEEQADGEEEKPLPFHEDPKVQRYVDKQIKKALEGLKTTPSEEREFKAAVAEDSNDLVAAFTAIIGNDTPEKVAALKALKQTLGTVEERAGQKAIEALQMRENKQIEADKQAQVELDSAFEEVEETYNVDLSSNTAQSKKTRSDFVDYIRKIAPKNQEGEVTAFPDIASAWEEFEVRQKRSQAPNRAKELAGRGLSRSGSATEVTKSKDSSWKGVEKFISSLKG